MYDEAILQALDSQRIRTSKARISLLSFDDNIIDEITGSLTSGTITVNGAAAVRRTLSLTMRASYDDIENINNIISINKKIKVEVGCLYKDETYWFPCGIFIISSANSARSTSGLNITIQGKDKMATLDGTAGGTLPASVSFHEQYVVDTEENLTIEYPTIFNIIQEAVVHYGGENINNVEINDVPDTAKLLLKWNGNSPLYLKQQGNSYEFTLTKPSGSFQEFSAGDDVCYEETPFTYPGELIMNAGQTVVNVLDKIVSTLGNYEYYYDLDGKFIFQQKKNYQDIQSPLQDLTALDYLTSYSNEQTQWSINDATTITAINKTPKYDNIKNDYIVWGTRSTESGGEVEIRYHLVIDEKPMLDKCLQYMRPLLGDNEQVIGYEFSDVAIDGATPPAAEWREELYRQALVAQYSTGYYSDYDAELIAEWRKIFDPDKKDWEEGWNPQVRKDPRSLDYWLDFIDSEALAPYSVKNIGRRSKVVNDKQVVCIKAQEVPDIMIIRSQDDATTDEKIKEYAALGQICVSLSNEEILNNLISSSTGNSAFDKIRDLLSQYLCYNTQLSITCTPKYWLEPNRLIYICDELSHLNDIYTVSQFTIPLNYSGLMNLTLSEIIRRI